MLKNYLKTAFRNILKNKGVFSINIMGLAIGIAVCIIILLFVKEELSYDTFNKNADNIARVIFKANINGENVNEAVVMAPVAQTLKNEFPEVVDATRLKRIATSKITVKTKTYRDVKATYVDTNFFDVFTLPIIKGNAVNPLDEPNTIVLTKAMANKYFGNIDVIGKTLYINNSEQPFKVTAFIDKVPENSHFHFDVFISMKGNKLANSASWTNSDFHTYLLLKDGSTVKSIEAKLPSVLEKYMGNQLKEELGVSYAEFTKTNKLGLYLQPLLDIHLNSNASVASELEQGGNKKYIYIFSAVAIFMLLIACVNFMNLSTATAMNRAKEVGIRKVLGSKKKQLVYQFLAEAFVVTIIAVVIALLLILISLPYFNEIANKALTVANLLNASTLLTIVLVVLLVSFMAGGYPAFYISSFKPITALKNKFSGSGKSKTVRSSLVVFQFAISTALVLVTLVIGRQINFIENKDVGYTKDEILVFRDSYLLGDKNKAFKNEVEKDSRVLSVSQSSFLPTGDSDTNMSGVFMNNEYKRRVFVYNVDDNYIPTMGMKLIAGRNFSKDFGSEKSNVIINEKTAKILGLGNDPIHKTFERDTQKGKEQLTIVGVVKDFNFKSLHKEIEPLIMLHNPYGGLVLRAKSSDMASVIKTASGIWSGFNTDEAFSYTLLNESYQQTYVKEQTLASVLKVFTLLTVFVACLGLFGVVTYTTKQRYKEIGIRKVLGSSISQIVVMLIKDFIKLVFISFLIAFPIGYYVMNNWLQDFAYRIDIAWWFFALSGSVVLLIALVTIGFKSISAAVANPTKSLRSE